MFILNERTNLKLKFIGIAIGLAGVTLLMTDFNILSLFGFIFNDNGDVTGGGHLVDGSFREFPALIKGVHLIRRAKQYPYVDILVFVFQRIFLRLCLGKGRKKEYKKEKPNSAVK